MTACHGEYHRTLREPLIAFLDEMGELPPALQAKLLRAAGDGVVEPLGATRPAPVDARIIAATRRGLRAAVAEGRFREDLYYRLACARIELPPLRSREGEIPKLALHFVAILNRSLPEPRALGGSALERLARSRGGRDPWLKSKMGRPIRRRLAASPAICRAAKSQGHVIREALRALSAETPYLRCRNHQR